MGFGVLPEAPPWGALPVEQYLIRNWDHSSPLMPSVQRQNLVQSFIALKEIPSSWDNVRARDRRENQHIERVPTLTEVETILSPWRHKDLRRRAADIWGSHGGLCEANPIVLRTHYSGSARDEEAFNNWISYDNAFGLYSCLVYNDERFFNFPDWASVYTILPELAGPFDSRTRGLVSDQDEMLEYQAELQAELADREPNESIEHVVYNGDSGINLRVAAIDNYMIIADAEGFQHCMWKLLWLDQRGDVVQWVRMGEDDITNVNGMVFRGAKGETDGFLEHTQRMKKEKYSVLGGCRLESGPSII